MCGAFAVASAVAVAESGGDDGMWLPASGEHAAFAGRVGEAAGEMASSYHRSLARRVLKITQRSKPSRMVSVRGPLTESAS